MCLSIGISSCCSRTLSCGAEAPKRGTRTQIVLRERELSHPALLVDARIAVDPGENLPVPNKAVLSVKDPRTHCQQDLKSASARPQAPYQWFSSGKLKNLLGTPLSCRMLNSMSPSETGSL